jgi:hypothetical protein
VLSPQVVPQSDTQKNRSRREQRPSPQQSPAQVCSSPGSHFPLPHVPGIPQSAGQVAAVSPASHLPFGHVGGCMLQSAGQLCAVSVRLQTLSPQLQSLQDVGSSSGLHLPSPQL